MSYVAKSIQGWKWEDLDVAERAQADAKKFFGLPKDGMETTEAFSLKESTDSRGALMFYYVGYEYPSQLNQALGEPETFDINIEIPE